MARNRNLVRLRISDGRLKPVDSRRLTPPPKQSDSIYATPEYKAWRDVVIGRAARRCQASGCGRSERRMFADHIVEIRDGGSPFDPSNGQCLCGSCHTRKTIEQRAERLKW